MKRIYLTEDGEVFDTEELAIEHEKKTAKASLTNEDKDKLKENLIETAKEIEKQIEECEDKINILEENLNSVIDEIIKLCDGESVDEDEKLKKCIDFLFFI